jgi:hypothetical protein
MKSRESLNIVKPTWTQAAAINAIKKNIGFIASVLKARAVAITTGIIP